jgi:MoxR-like ATPase
VKAEVISQWLQATHQEVAKVLVGQDDLIRDCLLALVARGHVLIEGVPGLGKTLLVRALAQVMDLGFRRIQFTPDLMPSDIVGGNVFDAQQGRFSFVPGPVFTPMLLADEVNRAPAKTQSALLEAMQERSVTTDGVTRPLPAPFIVFATQNPVESQGTYPLPEAQLDRFLLKVIVNHPEKDAEQRIVAHALSGFDPSVLSSAGLSRVLSSDHVLALQGALASIRVDPTILEYVVDLVARTRQHRSVHLGASPRASIALAQVARAHAAYVGRDFVIPDDVKALAPAVLRHRIVLEPDAEIEGLTADTCIEAILREAVVPRGAP